VVCALLYAGASYSQSEEYGWHIETVDAGGDVGDYNSIALDSLDHPHISYLYRDSLRLFYAHWDGGSWDTQQIGDILHHSGYYTSIAVDSSDSPHISCYHLLWMKLVHVYWGGFDFEFESVDSMWEWDGCTSIAIDSSDHLHISYYDGSEGAVKYAHWTGSEWEKEVLAYAGSVTSLALDSSDYPHISYFDSELKCAHWTGSEWEIESVDSAGSGPSTSIALDSNDRPHISYITGGNLKYARWTGSEWEIETVDNASYSASMALDSSDYPHISYNGNGALKYARWNGSAWQIETVDSEGGVGDPNSLALDSSDLPHISYYDSSNQDLKYARFGSSPAVEGAEVSADTCDDGVLVGWEITGDMPAGVRVLRSAGDGEPVAISGALPGEAMRWLDADVKVGVEYCYWLEATDGDGTVSRFGPTEAVTFNGAAREISLSVYPSPASGAFTVDYTLPEDVRISISLYDLSGRRVSTVFEGETAAGRHEFSCDASTLPPGVYLVRLATDSGTLTRRVVVAR
jgi:hypothetical protein